MAGQPSNYSNEIQDAIRTAIENQLGTAKGRRFELPEGATPGDTQFLTKHPDSTVPLDVGHMVIGMQKARRTRDEGSDQ